SLTTVAGMPTAFSLTNVDDKAHIISFDDARVQAVAVLVGPGQTKTINFNAPEETGTYTFNCQYHPEEVGEMIVN
ncbi:cupredoxin domain-containing protein, partial [Streptomyces sp. CHA1]|uniref:cupredoxin domain-containing protein n=1 Tax=Streptomyces sp. CHA1 TaxID=2841663 RepID=UPI002095C554